MTELEALREEIKSLRDEVARLRNELATRPTPLVIDRPYPYPVPSPQWYPQPVYTQTPVITCGPPQNTCNAPVYVSSVTANAA